MRSLVTPYKVIVLIGPPGVGKGTLATALAEQTGYFHCSTGEAMRAAAEKKTAIGRSIKELLDKGKLITDEIVVKVVREVLKEHPEGLILDGFPRTQKQAKWLDRQVPPASIYALSLQVADATRAARLANRGRKDDDPKIVAARDKDFRHNTQYLLPYYAAGKGKANRKTCICNNGTPAELLQKALAALGISQQAAA